MQDKIKEVDPIALGVIDESQILPDTNIPEETQRVAKSAFSKGKRNNAP